MHTVPWRSGASAPRKACRISLGFSPRWSPCAGEWSFSATSSAVMSEDKTRIPASAALAKIGNIPTSHLLHFERVPPSEEYVQRRTVRESRVARFEKIHIRLGNVRLLLAVTTAILAWAAFRSHLVSYWWLAVPVAAFGTVAFWHSRVLRSRELSQRAVAFYERGLRVFRTAGPALEKRATASTIRITSMPPI